MANCFEYGEKETGYLKSRDARLAGVIDKIGHIERETDPDLFSSVVHHIMPDKNKTNLAKTLLFSRFLSNSRLKYV